MCLKAVTGQSGEPRIEAKGIWITRFPNWIVFDHSNLTMTLSPLNTIFSLVNCLLESNLCTESGTNLDFLVIRKKAKRNKHQIVACLTSDKSIWLNTFNKMSIVIGRALFGICLFCRAIPLYIKWIQNSFKSGKVYHLHNSEWNQRT